MGNAITRAKDKRRRRRSRRNAVHPAPASEAKAPELDSDESPPTTPLLSEAELARIPTTRFRPSRQERSWLATYSHMISNEQGNISAATSLLLAEKEIRQDKLYQAVQRATNTWIPQQNIKSLYWALFSPLSAVLLVWLNEVAQEPIESVTNVEFLTSLLNVATNVVAQLILSLVGQLLLIPIFKYWLKEKAKEVYEVERHRTPASYQTAGVTEEQPPPDEMCKQTLSLIAAHKNLIQEAAAFRSTEKNNHSLAHLMNYPINRAYELTQDCGFYLLKNIPKAIQLTISALIHYAIPNWSKLTPTEHIASIFILGLALFFTHKPCEFWAKSVTRLMLKVQSCASRRARTLLPEHSFLSIVSDLRSTKDSPFGGEKIQEREECLSRKLEIIRRDPPTSFRDQSLLARLQTDTDAAAFRT